LLSVRSGQEEESNGERWVEERKERKVERKRVSRAKAMLKQ
jgi:hypothetical protein